MYRRLHAVMPCIAQGSVLEQKHQRHHLFNQQLSKLSFTAGPLVLGNTGERRKFSKTESMNKDRSCRQCEPHSRRTHLPGNLISTIDALVLLQHIAHEDTRACVHDKCVCRRSASTCYCWLTIKIGNKQRTHTTAPSGQ